MQRRVLHPLVQPTAHTHARCLELQPRRNFNWQSCGSANDWRIREIELGRVKWSRDRSTHKPRDNYCSASLFRFLSLSPPLSLSLVIAFSPLCIIGEAIVARWSTMIGIPSNRFCSFSQNNHARKKINRFTDHKKSKISNFSSSHKICWL